MLGERHLDLLTGAAQFTEDLVPADSLRAVLLRAPVGHGRITALYLSAARGAWRARGLRRRRPRPPAGQGHAQPRAGHAERVRVAPMATTLVGNARCWPRDAAGDTAASRSPW